MDKLDAPNISNLKKDIQEEEKKKEIVKVLFRGVIYVFFYAVVACTICFYFFGVLATTALIILLILCALYYGQDRLLYFPYLPLNARTSIPTPKDFDVPYKSVYIPTPDKETLHGYWIPAEENLVSKAKTILYLHGNAGNIGHRLPNSVGMRDHLSANVLMIDYRGYGKSTGKPCEKGLKIDARAGIDYLCARQDIDFTKIIIFGRSLGGAVAIDVAADPNYAKKLYLVIVENTFTSVRDMATSIEGSFSCLPNICYRNKYNSLEKIRKCRVPFLFVSGSADKLVPPYMMIQLYSNCRSSIKHFLPIKGGTHNETWTNERYYDYIRTFITNFENSENIEDDTNDFIIDMDTTGTENRVLNV